MDALTLGPLALPIPLLLALLALILAVVTSRYPRSPHGPDLEGRIWLLALAGLVGARLAFVMEQWPHYADQPWRIVDIRDGGLTAWAGWLTVALLTAAMMWRRPLTRRRLPAAVAVAALTWVVGNAVIDRLPQRGGHLTELASTPLQDLQGAPIALERFAGEPLVVNLWATWCPPCRREMPVFEAAQAEYADVNFVLVNQGEDAGQVQTYLREHGLALRHVWLDPRSGLSARAEAVGLPTTLFFDATGRLVYRRMGEVSAATLASQVDALRAATRLH